MVKNNLRITGGMTGEASRALINIAPDAVVVIICLGVGMASGTGKFSIIGRIGMAIHTSTPLSLVFTTVDREILPVVVKCGRQPRCLRMAGGTIC